jgi:hypothetical protein
MTLFLANEEHNTKRNKYIYDIIFTKITLLRTVSVAYFTLFTHSAERSGFVLISTVFKPNPLMKGKVLGHIQHESLPVFGFHMCIHRKCLLTKVHF